MTENAKKDDGNRVFEEYCSRLIPEGLAAQIRLNPEKHRKNVEEYSAKYAEYARVTDNIANEIIGKLKLSETGQVNVEGDAPDELSKTKLGLSAIIADQLRNNVRQGDDGSHLYKAAWGTLLTDDNKATLKLLTYPGDAPVDYAAAANEEVQTLMGMYKNAQPSAERLKALASVSAGTLAACADAGDLCMNSGFLRTCTKVTNKFISRGSNNRNVSDTTDSTNELETSARVVHIVVDSTTSVLPELEGEGLHENAIISQLAKGRATTGVKAPGLPNNQEEIHALQRLEVGSVSTPAAAATVMLATLVGWLMHMTELNVEGDEPVDRNAEDWFNTKASTSEAGYATHDMMSGLESQVAASGLGINMRSSLNYPLQCNDSGAIHCERTFISCHSSDAHDVPDYGEGYYLLAIPSRPDNQRALTACALALCAGRPLVSEARGHMQLMALANTSNVSFVAGRGGTAECLSNNWQASVTFGIKEVNDLIGYLVSRHMRLSTAKTNLAVMAIGSLFVPATASHHDYTNCLCAITQKIPHPHCEPVIDCVTMNTGRNSLGKQLHADARSLGIAFMRDVQEVVAMHTLGRSVAEITIAQKAPIAVSGQDIKQLQLDHAYALVAMARASDTAVHSTAQLANNGGQYGAYPAMLSISCNALGLDEADLRIAGASWAPHAYPYTPGCAYVNNSGTLQKLVVRDWCNTNEEIIGVLTPANAGISTIDNRDHVTAINQMPGNIIDMGDADVKIPNKILAMLNAHHKQTLANLGNAIAKTNLIAGRHPLNLTHGDYLEALHILDADPWLANDIIKCLTKGQAVTNQDVTTNGFKTSFENYAVQYDKWSRLKNLFEHKHSLLISVAKAYMLVMVAKSTVHGTAPLLGAPQAISHGWWAGAYVAHLARYHYLAEGNEERMLVEPTLSSADQSPNTLATVAALCYSAVVVTKQRATVLIESRIGSWSTIGTNITCGPSVPSMTIDWKLKRALSLDTDSAQSRDLAAILTWALKRGSSLMAKCTVKNTLVTSCPLVPVLEAIDRGGDSATRYVSTMTSTQQKLSSPVFFAGNHAQGTYVTLKPSDPTLPAKHFNKQTIDLSHMQGMLESMTNANAAALESSIERAAANARAGAATSGETGGPPGSVAS
nr:MAG: putative capsid protein [Cordyceps militaris quadrivirus 1]